MARNKPVLDYAKLDDLGTTAGLPFKAMTGQMADMDLNLQVGDTSTVNSALDHNLMGTGNSDDTDNLDHLLDADADQALLNNNAGDPNLGQHGLPDYDHDDDLLDAAARLERPDNMAHGPHAGYEPAVDQATLQIDEPPPDQDVGRDEVWNVQQQRLRDDQDKLVRLQKRMERQFILAQERVKIEQQKQQIAQMQTRIRELDHTRSVNNYVPASYIPQPVALPVGGIHYDTRAVDTMTPEEKVNVWFKNSPLVLQGVKQMPNSIYSRQTLRDQRKEMDSRPVGAPGPQPNVGGHQSRVTQAAAQPAQVQGVQYPPVQNVPGQPTGHQDFMLGPPPNRQPDPRARRGNSSRGRPSRGRAADNDGESNKSDSDDDKPRKLKSGFLDKPRSNVLAKLVWPHMSQNPRYVTSPLTFNQLTFQQFVGGEVRTILKTASLAENIGRLRLLSKIAYLFEQCKSWEKARSVYFAVLSSIEEGEADWNSSFGHYDIMCPPNVVETEKTDKPRSKNSARTNSGPKNDYFCKDYQKGDCTSQSPHRLWIKNQYEMVDHFCLPCFKAKLGKLPHNPTDNACAQKK